MMSELPIFQTPKNRTSLLTTDNSPLTTGYSSLTSTKLKRDIPVETGTSRWMLLPKMNLYVWSWVQDDLPRLPVTGIIVRILLFTWLMVCKPPLHHALQWSAYKNRKIQMKINEEDCFFIWHEFIVNDGCWLFPARKLVLYEPDKWKVDRFVFLMRIKTVSPCLLK